MSSITKKITEEAKKVIIGKDEVVETLENWLFREFMPRYFIDEDSFRKNHQQNKG